MRVMGQYLIQMGFTNYKRISWIKETILNYLSFADTTVQPGHLQCPLVEMGFTTSLCISRCIGISRLALISVSMVALISTPRAALAKYLQMSAGAVFHFRSWEDVVS